MGARVDLYVEEPAPPALEGGARWKVPDDRWGGRAPWRSPWPFASFPRSHPLTRLLALPSFFTVSEGRPPDLSPEMAAVLKEPRFVVWTVPLVELRAPLWQDLPIFVRCRVEAYLAPCFGAGADSFDTCLARVHTAHGPAIDPLAGQLAFADVTQRPIDWTSPTAPAEEGHIRPAAVELARLSPSHIVHVTWKETLRESLYPELVEQLATLARYPLGSRAVVAAAAAAATAVARIATVAASTGGALAGTAVVDTRCAAILDVADALAGYLPPAAAALEQATHAVGPCRATAATTGAALAATATAAACDQDTFADIAAAASHVGATAPAAAIAPCAVGAAPAAAIPSAGRITEVPGHRAAAAHEDADRLARADRERRANEAAQAAERFDADGTAGAANGRHRDSGGARRDAPGLHRAGI